MQLSEYPPAIAQAETALVIQKEAVQRYQDELDRVTNAIETEIAFDPNLKNEAQRKSRRFELMQSEDYCESAAVLRQVQAGEIHMEIHLRLLQNQFSVAKLQARRETGLTEAGKTWLYRNRYANVSLATEWSIYATPFH
jgi:hypothetical protein